MRGIELNRMIHLLTQRSRHVSVNSLNLIRMDIVKQHIVNAIVTIRRASKRPDAESIFKFISTNNASNFTMTDVVDALDKLKQKGKIEN